MPNRLRLPQSLQPPAERVPRYLPRTLSIFLETFPRKLFEPRTTSQSPWSPSFSPMMSSRHRLLDFQIVKPHGVLHKNHMKKIIFQKKIPCETSIPLHKVATWKFSRPFFGDPYLHSGPGACRFFGGCQKSIKGPERRQQFLRSGYIPGLAPKKSRGIPTSAPKIYVGQKSKKMLLLVGLLLVVVVLCCLKKKIIPSVGTQCCLNQYLNFKRLSGLCSSCENWPHWKPGKSKDQSYGEAAPSTCFSFTAGMWQMWEICWSIETGRKWLWVFFFQSDIMSLRVGKNNSTTALVSRVLVCVWRISSLFVVASDPCFNKRTCPGLFMLP